MLYAGTRMCLVEGHLQRIGTSCQSLRPLDGLAGGRLGRHHERGGRSL